MDLPNFSSRSLRRVKTLAAPNRETSNKVVTRKIYLATATEPAHADLLKVRENKGKKQRARQGDRERERREEIGEGRAKVSRCSTCIAFSIDFSPVVPFRSETLTGRYGRCIRLFTSRNKLQVSATQSS